MPPAEPNLRPFWRFLLSVCLTAAILFAAGTLLSAVGGVGNRIALVPLQVLTLAALVATYTWLLARADGVERRRLEALGLPLNRRAVTHSATGVLLGGAGAVLTAGAIAWRGALNFQITVHLKHDLLVLFVEVFVVLAAAAMSEELIFRGYPFQRLVEAIGAPAAVVTLSVLFGAVHLRNPHASAVGALNTAAVGVVLAIAYLRTRMLWLPFGIHWGWNAMLGAVIGLPVSGVDMSIAVHARATGPTWLTGGAYGPEASLPCTATLAVLLIIILAAYQAPARPTSLENDDVTLSAGIQSK